MLLKVPKPITAEDALGPQNRGIVNPELTDEQKKLLHEYRYDTHLADHGIGMQFTPDSPLPWLNPHTVKLNLGVYKDFSGQGWIQIAGPDEPRRDFNIALDKLHVKESTADFIFAPFCLENLSQPLQALRYWRDALKPVGILAVVINDRDKLIRLGREFAGSRLDAAALKLLLVDAGFAESELVNINFREFSLVGNDPGYSGYFAVK